MRVKSVKIVQRAKSVEKMGSLPPVWTATIFVWCDSVDHVFVAYVDLLLGVHAWDFVFGVCVVGREVG